MMVIYMRHVMVILISLMMIKLHVELYHSSHLHSMSHSLVLLCYGY